MKKINLTWVPEWSQKICREFYDTHELQDLVDRYPLPFGRDYNAAIGDRANPFFNSCLAPFPVM